MSNEERISLREFGRRIGCSDTAVRKAIKSGKIISGVTYDSNNKPWILPKIASAEWSKNYNPSYASSDSIRSTMEKTTPHQTNADDVAQSPGGNATLQAAKRAKAVYDAKLAELEYKQKLGELVKKDDVYKMLFAAGQELRTRIEDIPDRYIDDIFASPDRNSAHILLSKAIHEALTNIANLNVKL